MLGQHLKNQLITAKTGAFHPIFGNFNFQSYFAVIQHYNEQISGRNLQPTCAFYVKRNN
jgi:hypothetical protein